MSLIGLLFLCSLVNAAANSGVHQWTWIGGGASDAAVYGEQGIPDLANTPGTSMHGPSWTDLEGNFWMMVGYSPPEPNATMWKYDVAEQAWVWMHGQPGSQNASPNFGQMGVPDAGNWPGLRMGAACWTDQAGRFWVYGGRTRVSDMYDDMWMYDPSSGLWTWMAGTDVTYRRVTPVAGEDGAFSPDYTPGSRSEAGIWTDQDGNFWLYDGSNATIGDLWKFDPSILQWARIRPPAESGMVVGELGIPHPDNQPNVQSTMTTWTDSNGDLWMYGGVNSGRLWRYTLSDNCWTWMGGMADDPEPEDDSGAGAATTADFPMGRFGSLQWIDSAGDLWRFGGRSFKEEGGLTCYGDLWRFDAVTEEFVFINGPLIENPPTVFGEQGIPDPGNHPGARTFAHTWTGADGYLYFWGGSFVDAVPRSDMWRFNPGISDDTSVSNWNLY